MYNAFTQLTFKRKECKYFSVLFNIFSTLNILACYPLQTCLITDNIFSHYYKFPKDLITIFHKMQNNKNIQMVKFNLQIKKNYNKLITILTLFSIFLIIIFSLLFIYFYRLNDNLAIFIVTLFKLITNIDLYCHMSNTTRKIGTLIRKAGYVGTGVIAHHYGFKLLDRSENKKEEEAQPERDSKIDQMSEEIKNIKDQVTQVQEQNNQIIAQNEQIISQNEEIKTQNSSAEKLSKSLDTLSSDNNNKFMDDFDIKSFIKDIYDYLDTLTQIQELSLLHTLIFIIIILNLYSILGIFFGNELIKYFDLENKLPKLAFFFKLRTKFQRYYLIWNIFASFILCILALTLDVLTFIH